MKKKELIERIKLSSSVSGSFTLRSGEVSNTYFDKYQFESSPELLKNISEHLAQQIIELDIKFDFLAGMEMGGIPIVTMLSQLLGKPAVFIRKKAKTYGTCRIAEGADIKGKKLFIVEDVVTTGGAILDALPILREQGAQVTHGICVILRNKVGEDNLKKANLRLIHLCTKEELEL